MSNKRHGDAAYILDRDIIPAMVVYTLADITGTGATVALSATSQPCKWFQVTAVSIASSARLGDASTASDRGIPLPPASAQFFPPISEGTINYDLASQYAYIAGSDVISVAYCI
jgi:hypothetical protein